MTEEPKVDNVVEDGAASPSGNVVSDSAPAPIADVVTREEFSEALKELRGLQGRQDKADTKLSTAEEAIARYQAKIDTGMKPAEAEQAMAAEDKAGKNEALFSRLESFLDSAGGKVVDSGVNVQSEAARIIEEYGLDGNSVAVNEVLAKDLNGFELKSALLELAVPKKAASAPPPKTPNPVVPADEAALVNQYVKELQAAGTSRVAASGVRAKFEKLGVNTGAVTFH